MIQPDVCSKNRFSVFSVIRRQKPVLTGFKYLRVKRAHFPQNYLPTFKMLVNLIVLLLVNASTSHILTRINLRKKCLIFGKWFFSENIAKISSNWGILLMKITGFLASKKPVFGHWKLTKITGFTRPVKTGVSTLLQIKERTWNIYEIY